MNIDSIIFDLDGTLWDSTDTIMIAWNDVLEKHKEVKSKLAKEDLKGAMGLQIRDIGKKFFPYLNEDIQLNIMQECCKVECQYIYQHGGKLYNNLEETLITLSQRHMLFIASNCQCGYIEAFLETYKLKKYFLDFENPGRTGLTKGENIKLIIKRNNLVNPVYVGDTVGDLKAARFAGIPFVYARYGFGKVDEYDYAINSFGELLGLF